MRSYAVEASFLGSRAAAALRGNEEGAAVVTLPRAYAVTLRPCAEAPIDSKFALLLSDFRQEDGWRQERPPLALRVFLFADAHPFSPYVARRFPHISEINSSFYCSIF